MMMWLSRAKPSPSADATLALQISRRRGPADARHDGRDYSTQRCETIDFAAKFGLFA
jgi:hypothetical protein